MKKILIVKADINDGDYIYHIDEKFDDSPEERKILNNVAAAIKTVGKYNTNWSEESKEQYIADGLLTEEDIDYFDAFKPYGHDGNVHTIDSIRVITYLGIEKL